MAHRSTREQLLAGIGQVGPATADEAAAMIVAPVRSNLSLAWYRFRRHRMALVGGVLLLAVLLGCLVVPFFLPPHEWRRVSRTEFFYEEEVDLIGNLHQHFLGDRFSGRHVGPYTCTDCQRERQRRHGHLQWLWRHRHRLE